MRKILAFGLAAAMAVGALTAATGTASAKPWWMKSYPPMMYPYALQPNPGIFFSFNFGPPILYRSYPRYNLRYSGGNPHVNWCLSHYRTYNPMTNLYFRKKGVLAVCLSPFSY